MRHFVSLGILALLVSSIAAANELDVLPESGHADPGGMMHRHLLGIAKEAFQRRSAELEAAVSPQQIEQYQERRRDFMIEALGGFPERTPLNPQIVGTLDRESFRVEKVVFESQPNFFVTALLYLPISSGPHPVVLVPCGHSANGKAHENYQSLCMLLAMNGIAAFCYDPIGQGERSQLLDANGAPRFGSTTEHTMVGVGSMLLGRNTATYRVWDGIRALDYLCTRSDLDPNRIGCAGNSGGGTLTSYIMALDPRIQAAAPGCYITSFDRLLDTIGPQDSEQNIAGQIAFGLDHADYAIMRAPRPTLICAATEDFFDIEGTRTAFREAKTVYERLGRKEHIELAETNDKHGLNRELREAVVQWMRRWLAAPGEYRAESDLSLFAESDLQCTPKGQVLLMAGARSVVDLNMTEELRLGQRRHFASLENAKETQRESARAAAEIADPESVPFPKQEKTGTIERDEYYIDQYALTPEEGIVLPTLVYVPNEPTNETHIVLHGLGKTALEDEQEILAEAGFVVVAVDLRGFGETAPPAPDKPGEFDSWFSPEWEDLLLAYLLDTSYVSMRANDVLAVARFVQHHVPPPFRERVVLSAHGDASVPALHAAAIAPEWFTQVRLSDAVLTWKQAVSSPATPNQLVHALHGALRVYDLPDLIQSLPPSQLTIVSVAKDSL